MWNPLSFSRYGQLNRSTCSFKSFYRWKSQRLRSLFANDVKRIFRGLWTAWNSCLKTYLVPLIHLPDSATKLFPTKLYQHFLIFHLAMRILISDDLNATFNFHGSLGISSLYQTVAMDGLLLPSRWIIFRILGTNGLLVPSVNGNQKSFSIQVLAAPLH